MDLLISNQLIHHTLDSLELAKEILKLVLKYNVEYNGKKFTEKDTLGNLLGKFSQMFNKPYYNKLFDNALRISIAHNQYWWENNNFVYMKDGHETPLSQIEFVNAFNNIQEVAVSIINELKNRGFSF